MESCLGSDECGVEIRQQILRSTLEKQSRSVFLFFLEGHNA
jgi:hypothetical protein